MKKRHVESALVQILAFIALFIFLIILLPTECSATASACGATRVVVLLFIAAVFAVVVGLLHTKHQEHMAWREKHGPKSS